MRKSYIVDGMLSGTGIRDAIEGGYIEPQHLQVSTVLSKRIAQWLSKYEQAHFHQFEDGEQNTKLDCEGLEIAVALQSELLDATIEYFSAARLIKLPF